MNDGYTYGARLGSDARGRTAIEHLARRYDHSSREQWLERIRAGLVTLDGAPVEPDSPLAPGALLRWHRPPWEEPAAPLAFGVLYEDASMLAVAKPAGLPTLPGGDFLDHTLLALVRRRFPEASPMHRLGRWTSGLVLFARSAAAARELSAAWRAGAVVKRYRALAAGDPPVDRFPIDLPIGPVDHPRLGSVHGASPDGKPSLSFVEVVERRQGRFLAEVRIVTGRAHQIRIHLAAAGFPLVGDPLYGVGGLPLAERPGLPGDAGYSLHSMELRVRHPVDGREVRLWCAPPAVLRRRSGF